MKLFGAIRNGIIGTGVGYLFTRIGEYNNLPQKHTRSFVPAGMVGATAFFTSLCTSNPLIICSTSVIMSFVQVRAARIPMDSKVHEVQKNHFQHDLNQNSINKK